MADITDKLNYLPIDKATTTPTDWGPWELLAQRYWVVHPEHGLAFYDPSGRGRRISPQCNTNEKLVARLEPEGHEIRYFHRVWLRHDCNDYK